jgi:glycerophosphoryl diester phosphodiesterase
MRRQGRLPTLGAVSAALSLLTSVILATSLLPGVSQAQPVARFHLPASGGADPAGVHVGGPPNVDAQAERSETGGRSGVGRAKVPRPRYRVDVIGHRGAPVYRPQHTIEGYQLAIDQGADWIEPDLVPTRDGYLIARHEHDLTDTTDVRGHPELAALARDGRWYSEDLTLDQVRTLRAVGGPPAYSGKFSIPTIDEIVALLHRQKRRVGLYAEMKDPAYFRALRLPLEPRVADVLSANGWTTRAAPVVIECEEAASLQILHSMVDVRLVQLLPGSGPATDAELATIATYATAIGIPKDQLRGYLTAPPPDGQNLVKLAAAHHLAVHVFTFGARNPYGALPARFDHPDDAKRWAAAVALYRAYYSLGIQAVFTDTPDVAVYARG